MPEAGVIHPHFLYRSDNSGPKTVRPFLGVWGDTAPKQPCQAGLGWPLPGPVFLLLPRDRPELTPLCPLDFLFILLYYSTICVTNKETEAREGA